METSIVEGFNAIPMENAELKFKSVAQNVAVVDVVGLLDTYNSQAFQKKVGYLVENGYTNLVLNLGSTNYVSSTGIGSFTSFLKLVKPKGGDVVLVSVQPKVFEVFQLLGFSNFFNFEDSVVKAADRFKPGKVAKIEPKTFPFGFRCPTCNKNLRAPKPGRFRCPECKSILTVDKKQHVTV